MNAVTITPSPLEEDVDNTSQSLTEDEKNILKSLYFLDTKIELIIDRINRNVKLLLTFREIIENFGPTGSLAQHIAFRYAITISLNKNGVR